MSEQSVALSDREAQIAAWAINSYPERGDAAFMVHSTGVAGGSLAYEFWEGLRSYFVARPFIRAIQGELAEDRNEVAVSIRSQEDGFAIWREHARAFLEAMYAAHDEGAIPFGEVAGVVRAWLVKIGAIVSTAPRVDQLAWVVTASGGPDLHKCAEFYVIEEDALMAARRLDEQNPPAIYRVYPVRVVDARPAPPVEDVAKPRPRGMPDADGPDGADREAYIAAARAMYADPSNDDIEVDDDAQVHWTGAIEDDLRNVWVQAWVHVRQEDIEGE